MLPEARENERLEKLTEENRKPVSEEIKETSNIMIIVICPHCNVPVEIEQINCAIFRHAVYKQNNQQVPPHLPKAQCDQLVEQNLVYGCCKPFRVNHKNEAEVCDYI